MADLQQEKELIEQLASPKRSLVIQAIVKLSRAGRSKAALEALLPFLNSKDREISFFSFQSAGKIAEKSGINFSDFVKEQSLAQPSESQLSRQELLNPGKDKIPVILAQIRNEPDKLPREVLPAVAIFLSRHGDLSDGQFLEKFLLQEDSTLALPFIEAAERIAPTVLTRSLPHLLASREPLLRSRSISALRRIDPEEAERHFSDLLASRNPEDRLAGIAIAFLFPFERVKGYILSLLPEEKDGDVLKACQTFLASNPELDSALGLLDSIDAVSPEQKSRLTVIFKTVCQAMVTTGILSAAEAAPEEIIKVWKKQRLESFLNDLEIQLSFSDDTRKAQIIDWIEKNRAHPRVKLLIERLGRNPQTEKIFYQLTRPSKAEVEPEVKKSEDPIRQQSAIGKVSDIKAAETTGSDAEKIKKMRSLEIDDFSQNRAWLLSEAAEGLPAVKKEALSALLRLHPDNKLKELAKNASKEADEGVKIAAFQALERIDPEYLKENIGDFLQEDAANIRVRAVRFALKFKENEAIVILKNLLNNPDPRFRANAVACLGLCPFNLVFRILMAQLDKEDHPVIARHITSILLSNPSRTVLKGLDNVTRTSNPAVSMVISQARNDLFEIVSKLPEDKEESLKPVPVDEEKPYSVENVRKIARDRQKTWKPGYKPDGQAKAEGSFWENINWSMAISGGVVIVFLAMLPIMLLSDRSDIDTGKPLQGKDWRESERKKMAASSIPSKFRMNRPCSISVKIEKITSDTSMLVNHEDRQIMLRFETPEAKNLALGTELVVTMVPYRVNPRGIIQARGLNMAISKGQEQ
ncbi:MAG: HEAT repeat domain-containing protein [Candidatus Riflebacteria bacterium]